MIEEIILICIGFFIFCLYCFVVYKVISLIPHALLMVIVVSCLLGVIIGIIDYHVNRGC